jgi:membrane protein DedA with SNARE-associated domain
VSRDGFDIGDGQVRAGQDHALGGHPGRIVGYRAPMLAFIDQIVIPFLNALYGAVGYVGIMLAMTIESAMVPLPSELVLPYAGFLVSDPSKVEPLTHAQWEFWIVVAVATLGNTLGSIVGYAIGAWGGRPLLERWGRYLLIRPHELELADRFFQKYGPATAFFSRLLPIVRTFISFPAGVARMPLGKFILYSTLGAIPWSILLVSAGVQLGARWTDIRHTLQPFDTAILVLMILLVAGFIWWRLGRPGWRRPPASTTEEPGG